MFNVMTIDIQKQRILVGATGWHKLYDDFLHDEPISLGHHYRQIATKMSLGEDCHLDLYTVAGRPLALVPILSATRYRFISLQQLYGGPLFAADVTAQEKAAVFHQLAKARSRWRWQFVTLQPAWPQTDDNQQLIKAAGFKKIMSGASTAWLSLKPDVNDLRAGLLGKWRNQLVKSEKQAFQVSLSFNKTASYHWLVEKDFEQSKQKNYLTASKLYIDQYQKMSALLDGKDSPSVMMVHAHERREKLSAALFLIHGTSATYLTGWSSDKGRMLSSQNRVVWQAILALKEKGIQYLDMGGLDTETLASVARFKLGTGAEPVTYVGTFA